MWNKYEYVPLPNQRGRKIKMEAKYYRLKKKKKKKNCLII